MDRAAEAFLDSPDGQQEGAALRLWPPTALDRLLAALRSDPSIKVRRGAMNLLSSVAVAVGSPQEAVLLNAVAQRCRDKDDEVREQAFAMLAQFLRGSLVRLLSVQDWQAVLDAGLAGPLPRLGGKTGSSKQAVRRTGAIRAAATELLQLYLCISPGNRQGRRTEQRSASRAASSDEEDLWEDSSGEEEDKAGDLDQAGTPAAEQQEDAAWPDRLQQLGIPHLLNGTNSAASHLQGAWRQALQKLLNEEQLAASGILPDYIPICDAHE